MVIDREGLTRSRPVKEQGFSRGVSDSIGNNYSLRARDLDVRALYKSQPFTHQRLPRNASSLGFKMKQNGKNGLKSGSTKTPTSTEPNVDRLPPILARSNTLVTQTSTNYSKPVWSRARTRSDASSLKAHTEQVKACLSVTFKPWYTSTIGLTRPSTPIDRDIPRFYHLVDNSIDRNVVAPLCEQWKLNIKTLVGNIDKYPKLAEQFMNEVDDDFNRAIRISILNYILMDPDEQKRLGVSSLRKVPISAEPPTYPWRPSIFRIRSWMQNEQPATLHIVQRIYTHTMEHYENFKLLDISQFEGEMPMSLAHFLEQSKTNIKKSVLFLKENWLSECCKIVHEHREEMEELIAAYGNSEMRQSKMDKTFQMIASAMGKCLRTFVTNTLESLIDWVQQYQKGNSYEGEFNLFSKDFQPVRPIPFVTNLLAPTMVDGKQQFKIHPGFSEFEKRLHNLVDYIVGSVQELQRIEFQLFQIIEGMRVKYIRTVRDWEEIVAKTKDMISIVVNVNSPGPRRYRHTYDKFHFITSGQAENHISNFLASKREKKEIAAEIEKFKAILIDAELLPQTVPFDLFLVDCHSINEWLVAKAKGLCDQLKKFIYEIMVQQCQATCHTYERHTKRLLSKLENTDDVVSLISYIENLELLELTRIKAELLRKSVEEISFVYDYAILDDQHMNLVTNTALWPDKIRPIINQSKERCATMLDKSNTGLKHHKEMMSENIDDFSKRLKEFMQRDKISEAVQNVEDLKNFAEELAKMNDEKVFINHEEVLLQVPEITPYHQLVQLQMRKEPYEKLWAAAVSYQVKTDNWMNGPITKIDPGKVEEEVNTLWRELYRLLKVFSRNDTKAPFKVAQSVKMKLEKFKREIPLILAVCNPGMRDRHWEIVHKKIGLEINLDDSVTLSDIVQMNLDKHLNVLNEVAKRASIEFALEKAILKMKSDWENMEFTFVPYKNTGVKILSAIDEIQSLLEDHALKTLTVKSSPYVAPFQKEIIEWDKTLALMSAVMESWLHVQASWLYLVTIFTSDNIKTQMPEEAEMFAHVDVNWRGILLEVYETPKALSILPQSSMLEKLQEAEKKMNIIGRRLDDYLEGKRIYFPQFFFLSNHDLLEILSEILNPLQVQPHLRKCFQGIMRLTFSEDNNVITGMESAMGEMVAFENEVYPKNAKGLVEVWLKETESEMRTTLKKRITNCQSVDVNNLEALEVLIYENPAQVCFVSLALQWTADTIEAIKRNRLPGIWRNYSDMVENLCKLVRQHSNTSKGYIKSSLFMLVTIAVHWRDVLKRLASKNCHSTDDFDWSAQLKYLQNEQSDVSVQMMSTSVSYSYEYYGNLPRLVVTPLTERCQRTILTALNMDLGTCLQGVSDTGKTETVKDLSAAVAKRCFVFNCSDGVNCSTFGLFLKGIVQLGAWSCFEEFK